MGAKRMNKQIEESQLQSLQNFGNSLNLKIVEKFTSDKRKSVKKYFAIIDGVKTSPVLDYQGMNNFMLGWLSATKP